MWQTVGQDRAIALFDSGLRAGRLSHAYLFVGPPHVGKTTLAMELAQAVNCTAARQAQGEWGPCGECPACRRVPEGKHADVRVVSLETGEKERTEIGIEAIRDIQSSAYLPPYEGGCKVFIIEGAESLSLEAANALLKVLEEPALRVMFLLLTSQEGRVLPTIASRCQRIELRRLSVAGVEGMLVERHHVAGEQAAFLARLSEGCPGKAVSAATGTGPLEQRGLVIEQLLTLSESGYEVRFARAEELGRRWSRSRRSGEDVLRLWLSWWRDLLLVKGGAPEGVANIDYIERMTSWAGRLSLHQIKRFMDVLLLSRQCLAENASARLVAENLLLELPRN